MKKFIAYISILVATSSMLSCANFDEMNENPYAIYETTAETFVQPILYNAEYTLVNANKSLISPLMQNTVSTNYETSAQLVYNYVIPEATLSSPWSIYAQFGNAQYMLEMARKEQNPAMTGVALVLRSFIGAVLTDIYGNVPYFEAGKIALQGDSFEYTTPYDDQKAIYADILRSLEEANDCFNKAKQMYANKELTEINFNPTCDYMYNGVVDQWHRFGNSLYLRLLMRVALKTLEETGGEIDLGEEYGSINVLAKITEIYNCFVAGDGNYPVMRSVDDSARVTFSDKDSALYTPFYKTTSGVWRNEAACNTLTDLMIFRNSSNAIILEDPRFYRIFTKPMGAPTQILREDMKAYFEEKVSSQGNSLIGRYTSGSSSATRLSGAPGIGNLKNADSYALMNYDEILFLFAEAGARNWIPTGQVGYKKLYLDGILNNVLQWEKGWESHESFVHAASQEVIDLVNYWDSQFDYNKALECIMTQKYIATTWVGVETWADYRRTGYPILKTNGPAASNRGILPTRMRYPATEAFQNAKHYEEAVSGWLGGENDMLTDMWWANTAESKALRKLGRQ